MGLPFPFYAHMRFFGYPLPPCTMLTWKLLANHPPHPHTTHYLTHDAFQYLSIKSYETLNQLKNNRKQKSVSSFMFLIHSLQNNGKDFLTIYLYLVGNFRVLCRASSTLRNFATFFALDFRYLRNRLKVNVNIEHGLKRLLNGFWIYPLIESPTHPLFRFFNTRLFFGCGYQPRFILRLFSLHVFFAFFIK